MSKSELFIKNFFAPIALIFFVPCILFKIIININTVSNLIIPNIFSISFLFSLLSYGYLSIKLSDKRFRGNTNVDDTTPYYAANGFKFWLFTLLSISLISNYFTNFPKLFVENFVPFILSCNIFGLLFVTYLYLRDNNNYYDKEKDDKLGYNTLFKFFRGLKFHPTFLGVDVKQWTNCRFGMISWQIIIELFFFYYYNTFGFNWAIFTTVFLQTVYIGKFFYWETGYFNTLDITLDRGGYYICWGCLVFIPSFYTFTVYYLINVHPNLDIHNAIFILGSGLLFTYMNYDVDAQKELFKKNKEKTIINNKPVKFLTVKYFKNNNFIDSELLLSGYWGISRHMNYTFEILMSACWSFVGYQHGIMPFFYLFYIIFLLVHRIYRDEKKCKEKYGKYWDIYCNIVKYRLIKYIY